MFSDLSDLNTDLLYNFDDFGLEMILHYQDHGLAAIFSDGRVLPRGYSTDFKIKIEEVSFRKERKKVTYVSYYQGSVRQ